MGVKLQSSSGGSVEIAAPATASNYVLTAPAANGNVDYLQRAGNVLQVVHQEYTTYTSTTSTSFPATGLTASITPTSSSSFILVCVKINGCESGGITTFAKYELYKNGASISYLNEIVGYVATAPVVVDSGFAVDYKDNPGVTSALTYTVHFSSSSGTRVGFNNYGSVNGRTKSTITLMEIAG